MLNCALKQAKTVAIGGHIRPDGDCFGSCMGLYQYIRSSYPDIAVDVYLEEVPVCFRMFPVAKEILHEVKDDVLHVLLEKCKDKVLYTNEYACFKEDLTNAKELLYICDNCGEVVLDKFLLEVIVKQFPYLKVRVMVRGGEVINDASRVDAEEIALADVCEVVDSGIAMCGCDIAHIGEEALSYVREADVIIAKGQANFETLFGNNLPVYYLLLCKCDMFVARFAMEKFAPVFMKEERIVIHNK